MSLITVIVPVYKVEPYLSRCVDSILAQTFTDFELILVDDGSPDKCGAICDEYAEKHAHIHVIHQPNGGLSAARNAGIEWAFSNSDSKWLAFIDSDDWVHPKYLEFLYRAAQENNVKISVCEYKETDTLKPVDSSVEFKAQIVNGIDFWCSEKNVIATVAWNKIYQKDIFYACRYPVGKIHEDEYVTYKLLYQTRNIVYVKVPLYYYYHNLQGITKSAYSLKRLDAIEAMEEQRSFLKKIGKQEGYEKKVSKMAIIEYPSHILNLNRIGATKKAQQLLRQGRKLVLQNIHIIGKLSQEKKDYIFAFYFPHLNRLIMPFCNLIRMLSRGGLREAVQYYKHKFLKTDR